jgi:hypothetical protein
MSSSPSLPVPPSKVPVEDPTAPPPAHVAGAAPMTKWSRGRALCAQRVAQLHPSLPVSPEARCVAVFVTRPNHLAADEPVALDSGHRSLRSHRHSLRRRLAVRTRPAPSILVAYRRIPKLARAAPPRERARRRLNAGQSTWHTWGPPLGHCQWVPGGPVDLLTRSTLTWPRPVPLTCGPRVN